MEGYGHTNELIHGKGSTSHNNSQGTHIHAPLDSKGTISSEESRVEKNLNLVDPLKNKMVEEEESIVTFEFPSTDVEGNSPMKNIPLLAPPTVNGLSTKCTNIFYLNFMCSLGTMIMFQIPKNLRFSLPN